MDILTVGLIFLIALLSIFLTVAGLQVFFILRDLRRALARLNKILYGEKQDQEEKVLDSSNSKSAAEKIKASTKPSSRRFFKRL